MDRDRSIQNRNCRRAGHESNQENQKHTAWASHELSQKALPRLLQVIPTNKRHLEILLCSKRSKAAWTYPVDNKCRMTDEDHRSEEQFGMLVACAHDLTPEKRSRSCSSMLECLYAYTSVKCKEHTQMLTCIRVCQNAQGW